MMTKGVMCSLYDDKVCNALVDYYTMIGVKCDGDYLIVIHSRDQYRPSKQQRRQYRRTGSSGAYTVISGSISTFTVISGRSGVDRSCVMCFGCA